MLLCCAQKKAGKPSAPEACPNSFLSVLGLRGCLGGLCPRALPSLRSSLNLGRKRLPALALPCWRCRVYAVSSEKLLKRLSNFNPLEVIHEERPGSRAISQWEV